MKKSLTFALISILLLFTFALVSCTDYETQYNELQEQYNLLLSENETLKEDYNELTQENETLKEDYDELTQDIEDNYIARHTYDNLLERYDNLSSDYNELEDKYDNLKSDYTILESNYKKAQSQPAAEQNTQVKQTQQQQQQTYTYNVVVTRTGDKYHTSTCRYVKNKTDTRTMSLSSAKSSGYTACKVCNP